MTDGAALPHALPASWAVAVASEVCERIQDGTHFSPKNQRPSGKYPYVTAKNVRPRGLDLSNLTYLDESEHRPIYDRSDVKHGDVLLVKDGVNAGDAALNTIDGEISLLSSVCFLRPTRAALTAAFLRYYLLSPFGYTALTGKMTGTAIRRVVLHRVRSLSVPVAPLSEQRAVVAALDSYFSRLDDAVATLERVQRNLKRYRVAVLKAAVEGRLVPTEVELSRKEGRDCEPADVLLARILKERKARWINDAVEKGRAKAEAKAKKVGKEWGKAEEKAALEKARAAAVKKYKEPVGPDTSGLPELPEGWCWARVETLYWSAGYGTSQKCTYEADGPPVLRIPNVDNGRIDLSDLKFAIASTGLKTDGLVTKGDFLFIRTNGSRNLIGRGAPVVDDLPQECHFASYLIRLRLAGDDGLPSWLGLAWHSETVRNQILADAASSAGQYNVSLGAAKGYAIPLPPAAEWPRIAAEVARRWSVSDAAAEDVTKNLGRLARLRQSILKWAFEGKLVDQDPDDKPASVLLERIKAEREADQAAGKKNGKPARKTRKEKSK